MNIKDFLSPADTMLDLQAPDKTRLLHELAQHAAASLSLPAEGISSEILKREGLGSTGTGGGVAIPHARIRGLNKPFGILVRLKQPIDFNAIDGQPVDLLFLLLLPIAADKEHLVALASVTGVLRSSKSVHDLRRARDGADLFRVMIAGTKKSAE